MGIAVEKIKSNVDASVLRIELNDMGDYAAISADDDALFDRFVSSHAHIAERAEQFDAEIAELEKQKKQGTEKEEDYIRISAEMIRKKRAFSEEVAKVTDNIFGEGTVRKLFRSVYEEIPDFLPSAESITTFLESVTPQIEQLFHKKIDERNKASRARMAKYIPQDHKRTQRHQKKKRTMPVEDTQQ